MWSRYFFNTYFDMLGQVIANKSSLVYFFIVLKMFHISSAALLTDDDPLQLSLTFRLTVVTKCFWKL